MTKITIKDDITVEIGVKEIEKAEINIKENLIYGIFGIVMAIVGFLVWIWAFMEKTQDHILMFLSFGRMFGISALQFLPESLVGVSVTKGLLIALASTISILLTLWGVATWRGQNKLSIQEFISRIGYTHYYIGVGFLVASATVFIDWKLSIGVVILNLLIGMLLLFVMSANIFKIPSNRTFSFVSLAFSAYFILFVIMAIVIF